MLHVKKNMLKTLVAEGAAGILKYESTVRAPSRAHVDAMRADYGPRQPVYLENFPNHELYSVRTAALYATHAGTSHPSASFVKNWMRPRPCHLVLVRKEVMPKLLRQIEGGRVLLVIV